MPAGYKKLDVWNLAREVVIEIHAMTLRDLPKFEMYETGSQIRRSSKSVKSNIVEGCGRRRHTQEYLRYLDFAYASCLETIDHLETLHDTGSLAASTQSAALLEKLEKLAGKLYRFAESVSEQHNRPA